MTWLGIDGGGTKTACTLYNESLQPLARTTFSTCHYAQAGADGMTSSPAIAWHGRTGTAWTGTEAWVWHLRLRRGSRVRPRHRVRREGRGGNSPMPWSTTSTPRGRRVWTLRTASPLSQAPARSRLACETAPACVAAGGTTYWGTRAAVAGLARRPCAPSPAKATGATSAGLSTTPLNENSA